MEAEEPSPSGRKKSTKDGLRRRIHQKEKYCRVFFSEMYKERDSSRNLAKGNRRLRREGDRGEEIFR